MSPSDDAFSLCFKQFSAANQELLKAFQQPGSNNPMQQTLAQLNAEDFSVWAEGVAQQPVELMQAHMKWWQDQMLIWQNTLCPGTVSSDFLPSHPDPRFKDSAWQEQAVFSMIKQSYQLFGEHVLGLLKLGEGLDPKVQERLEFFTRQTVNAMSPSNFVGTNPELIRLTLESQGMNLVHGMEKLQEDLKSSADILNVRLSDKDAFVLGRDVAVTPGEVVYRNELMELIQYHPQSQEVLKKPLLVAPPFINKYYVLDLSPKNSAIRWFVEQGHTVFVISWRNPGAEFADKGIEDYVINGVMASLDAIEQQTGEREINGLGYCIGGVLLTITVAYMAGKRIKQRIKNLTLLTTPIDFSQPGEVGVFINEPTIEAIEMQNNLTGYMDGRMLGVTFSMLRENSLYWNYFVENYLKGKSPMDFDLLFWNSDSTNVTAACHNFILRQLYLENKLLKSGAIKINGVAIDLSKIKVPTYCLSTSEDHIATWQGTFDGAKSLKGEVTFVLGESGHVAGVINPPEKNRYGYWVDGKQGQGAQHWLDTASHHKGSWWTHWQAWIAEKEANVEKVPGREVTKTSLAPAPGEYVRQQLPV